MRSAVTSATTPDPDVTRRAAGNLSCPRRRIAVGLSGIPRPMINWANFISQCFNGLVLGALLALVSSGLTIIYGMLGVLNLAHGAMFMLGGYAGWLTYSYTDSFIAAVLAGAIFVMIVGVLVERVIIRHFYNRPHEDQLLVTFGLGIVFVETVRFFFGSLSKTVPPPSLLVGITPIGFMLYPTYRLALLGIVAVALLALYVVLYRTRIGMIVRAGIEDSVMVDSLGIDVYRVFMLVFGIGAMAAGFAGIVNAPVVSIAPDVGEAILVQTFVVVVIGGVGSFPGAILGGLIAGEIISITSMFNPGYSYVMLIAAPLVLPYLGFTPTTINRILVWGVFGIGFDILFGFTGLLSFGQSAFFGTGGMVAAYLLTIMNFPYVMAALVIGMMAAAVVGYLVGLIALRRTGIYFAMITVAIAEVFFFVEFNPLSAYTGGENGLPGVPTPQLYLGFATIRFDSDSLLYVFLAFWYFVGLVIALRIVRSPVGAVLRAIRDNPVRAAAVGHNIHGYKLTAFVVAAAYAGFAGGLLGVMQGFMPPDAFMFETSGQLVMQTAIGGAGTLLGPLVGAMVWLYLSDFLQTTLNLGAAWKLVLGVIFVLLVCFLRRGLIGGIADLYQLATGSGKEVESGKDAPMPGVTAARQPTIAAMPARHRATDRKIGPILLAKGLTKHYGGLAANSEIDFAVNHGELRGIIGPNGAGKTTFFKMLTCEVPPTSGRILFEGRDITGMTVTDVCQLGLTKSYQINQLFNRLTVRENLTIAALAERRGKFRLDLFKSLKSVPQLSEQVERTLALVDLAERAEIPVSDLAYGEKRRLEVGLALATSPSLLLLDEPLAGMSPRERVEMVRLLKSIARGRTVIIIDHDMDSLFELVERVTVLQEGRVLLEGTPDEIKGN